MRLQALAHQLANADIPSSFVNQPSLHTWGLSIQFSASTGPVDSILIGLIQRQRKLALSSVSRIQSIGPYQPSMKTLLYAGEASALPNLTTENAISSTISYLLHQTALRDLTIKAACLIIMYHLSQWQIQPSKSTYDALPDWQTPRTSQLLTPHPLWVSLIVWGKLRDVVIENQELYATEEFQYICSSSLNINWPHKAMDAFQFVGDEVRVSEVFDKHVRNLGNWSLDAPFVTRYPELSNVCRFT